MKTLIIALYNYNAQGLDAWLDHGSGMAYTSAFLAGHNVSFLDMKSLSNDEELKNAMKGYDLIAFGLKSSYYSIGMKILNFAKAQGSKTLVAGYHVTAAPEELLENPQIDYILHGESEITFSKFLSNPDNFPREIFGETIQNLDDLPFMFRDIYADPLEPCKNWWYGYKLAKMTTIISSRGCPYKCSFCQPIEDNHFGKKLRRRSVDSVISELKEIQRKYSPECLMIHDDTFLLQCSWLEEFIEKYPQIGLPFWAAGRADGIIKHEDLVHKLVKVGWDLVSVGFESGSQRILDKMKKDTTVEQNLEAAKIIHSAGGKIYANYILGLPWETKWDIQQTVKMADSINAEMPSWAFFTPYPGCELADEVKENNWSLLDREHYDRCPSGKKVKCVDYDYIHNAMRGFREERPKVLCDIIIPTYENEQLTLDCLKSIKENTTEGTYRVILVDNGSINTQRVEQFLSGLEHLYIHFPDNRGFVSAINKGISLSDSEFVCLLNNDTRVYKGWLTKLLKILEDKSIGIVGPLTGYHKIGSDSPHSLELHSVLLPPEAREWSFEQINSTLESTYSGQTKDADFVAFLCGVMRRSLIDEMSAHDSTYSKGLDEGYAHGMWDDVDYNKSVCALGYRTVFALDTCIYHKGRSTFNMVQEKEGFDVGSLLKRNKEYLDRKFIDTALISRSIYDRLGNTNEPGVLTPLRLKLIQENFINSLNAQTDKKFTLYMILGEERSEATNSIKSLDWKTISVVFIHTSPNFNLWQSSIAKGNFAKEASEGSPESIAKISHPMHELMIRMDNDDYVLPGFIAHVKYLATTIEGKSFLLNYQILYQTEEGFLFIPNTNYSSARTSPFIALVQHVDNKISPYKDSHLAMGKYFSKVYTVPPGYCISALHSENRGNRLQTSDIMLMPSLSNMPITNSIYSVARKNSWKTRMKH